MKIDNLALTDLPQCFSKTKKNIPLGFWCQNQFDYKHIYKNLYLDHWYNKKKKTKDIQYLLKLNERIVKFLADSLNKAHKKNYSEKYWRILIGPYLFWVIPSIFNRWEVLRTFFKKSRKKYSFISQKKCVLNPPFTTLQSVNMLCNDSLYNHNIFSKIILSNYQNRISDQKKTIKIRNDGSKYLDIFNWKLHEKKSIISNIKNSSIFFKIIIFFNKYLFDSRIFTAKKFLLLNLKLKNLPFSTENFFQNKFFNFIRKFKNKKHAKETHLRNKLFLKKKMFSADKFEIFLLNFVIENLPKIYVEHYAEAKNEVQEYLTKKKKIIFSQHDILFNEIYKIWVAEMLRLNSKLIISDHGTIDPCIVPTNLFHESKISNINLISHTFGRKKNQIKASTTLPLAYKTLKYNYKNKNIIFIHRELPRYNVKVTSSIAITSIIEFFYIKKLIKSLPESLKNNIKYKCINNFGLNLVNSFSSIFGKKKIISKNQKYEDTLKSAKIVVSLYLSTPTVEAIKLNIPTLILLPKETMVFEKRFYKYYSNLKKNKILFDDPEKMSKHIKKIWNNTDDWWQSKSVIRSKKLYLDGFLFLKSKNFVENEYIERLKGV